MTIKISINDKEIANPFLRLGITIVAVSLALVIISVVLFVLLPIVWLAILWLVVLILSLPLIVTGLIRRHGDISPQKELEYRSTSKKH